MRVRPWILILTIVLLASLAATPFRGGWVITTMHEWPERLEAGTPTTLTFTMRQHGEETLSGRAPTVRLSRGGWLSGRERIEATRTKTPGVYRATFTPEEAGTLTIAVDTDFNGWTTPMLPLEVAASGTEARAPEAVRRGRDLFVAKGCVGCHVKADDDALEDYRTVPVGPALSGRTYPAEWLIAKILDPAAQRTGPDGRTPAQARTMPQLEVNAAEAAAIASYLNARRLALR